MNDSEHSFQYHCRQLLLPVSPNREREAAQLIFDKMVEMDFSVAEMPHKLYAFEEEQFSNEPLSKEFKAILNAALSNEEWAEELRSPASIYTYLRSVLVKSGVETHASRVLISYLPLIHGLAKHHKMSAAAISSILSKHHISHTYHWKVIQKILCVLKLGPVINIADLELLISNDQTMEVELFSDADLKDAIEITGDWIEKLSGVSLHRELRRLMPEETEGWFIPYIQVLHYCALTGRFYDHPTTCLYEFRPRGEKGEIVFALAPTSMAPKGNPILNNFKAVDHANEEWAAMREDNPAQARALVDILKNLEAVPYGARKAALEIISCLVFRLYRLSETAPVTEIKRLKNIRGIKELQDWLIREQTGTKGILEQRFFDAYLKLFYYTESKIRLRGIGDSVNASNLSKKKFGDLEAFNAVKRQITAFEIHGGKLSEVYVASHLRSLERVLAARWTSLEEIAELKDWKLEIIFIAHHTGEMASQQIFIEDLNVKISYFTYDQFFAHFPLADSVQKNERILLSTYNQLLVESLNSVRVPLQVKERISSRVSA